jgi:hypothetical protein
VLAVPAALEIRVEMVMVAEVVVVDQYAAQATQIYPDSQVVQQQHHLVFLVTAVVVHLETQLTQQVIQEMEV